MLDVVLFVSVFGVFVKKEKKERLANTFFSSSPSFFISFYFIVYWRKEESQTNSEDGTFLQQHPAGSCCSFTDYMFYYDTVGR